MDELTRFKEVGEVKLTVPLVKGFDKILQDVIRITVVKSGFNPEDSGKIAEWVSSRVFEKLLPTNENDNHRQIEILLAHRPGQITIKTAIPSLGYNEVEEFKVS
jgi:hypothetical protein